MEPHDIVPRVSALVDGWCERRCLRPLREILGGWPLTSGLTDEWAQLGDALKAVRAFSDEGLTRREREEVDALIAAVDGVGFGRHS